MTVILAVLVAAGLIVAILVGSALIRKRHRHARAARFQRHLEAQEQWDRIVSGRGTNRQESHG